MATAQEIANLVLLWNDAVTEIPSVVISAHSTETAGFVAENLLDVNRQNVFSASPGGYPADNVHVEFDLLSATAIKGFALLNHNMGTRGVSTCTIRADNSTPATTARASFSVSAVCGDDDFFMAFTATQTYRYWRVEWDSVDAAALYMGRVFLAQDLYDCGTSIRVGAQKGWQSSVEILTTPGGVEHRFARGSRRKMLSATLPNQTGITTIRTQVNNLVEHVEVQEKPFVHSWPYGSSVGVLGSATLYGMAVHARFISPEYLETLMVATGVEIPFNTIEVL